MKIELLLFILVLMAFSSSAQDIDDDGISDEVEEALVKRFAPEWRYNKEISNPPIGGSNQNKNEWHYACSIDWIWAKTKEISGQFPRLTRKQTCSNPFAIAACYDDYSGEITTPNDIINIQVSTFDGPKFTTDQYWEGYEELLAIRLVSELPGDPNNFPTYVHCYCTNPDPNTKKCVPGPNNHLYVGYLIFHPFDNKAEFGDFGNHVGDFEGINVKVSGVNDFNSLADIPYASVDRIIFSGHGPNRYILGNSPSLELIDGMHPRIYLAFGSHTPYPEPGILTDYNSPWSPDIYDDFFLGNGLIVQSWASNRSFINMGETFNPNETTKWINYRGLWGTDNWGSNKSTKSPPFKGGWSQPEILDENTWFSWEDIKADKWSFGGDWTGGPPVIECKRRNSTWYADGQPQILLFQNPQWDGNVTSITSFLSSINLPTGPFAGDGIGSNSASSVILLGGSSVALFDEANFAGASIFLNSSNPNIHELGFGDATNSAIGYFPINPIWDGVVCNIPVDWENSCPEPSYPPFKTISQALSILGNVNYPRGICISAGVYHDTPILGTNNQSFIIKAEGGPAIIGQQ